MVTFVLLGFVINVLKSMNSPELLRAREL